MTRKLRDPMPEAIVVDQRRASDPERSVWVTANAGSGKTYVLTARVLRLLLSGTKPEEILCLTYTKAAAAEMRGRVAERLGEWSLMSEADLVADLTRLGGKAPAPGALIRARTLFAHALETPGGLKIQTIHAFCESVLHRFPREAGVPFDFSVLEEHERDGLLREAREFVLAEGVRGSQHSAAVETLFDMLSDFSIEQSIIETLNQQRTLRRVLADPAAAKAELHRQLPGARTVAAVEAEISSGYGLSAEDHATILRLVPPNPAGDSFIDRLSQIDLRHPDPAALFEAFLTQERTARKTLLKKATAALIPEIAARAMAEGDRLERLAQDLVAAQLIARSEAMLDVVGAISAHYEAAKRDRSLLDFDDLIEKLAALLKNDAQGDWVRYKLDSGITHILVDEGQDTNPQQWEVVRALVDDFFVGDSAADRPRTIFAVGDQKQSIFSFQGADPHAFLGERSRYTLSAWQVDSEITSVPLHYSFRTLPNVLAAVDKVFERADLREGLLEDTIHHDTARAEGGGIVTLWPPIQDVGEETDPDNWPTEPPDAVTKTAARQIAERIARQIAGWIDSKRPLGPRGRPVRADDVLILVQVRSILFHEIIRALIREGVPTPGADRLAVTTHLGVLDLMALGDVLSNPADSLQLAALLRSPLFDVSEDDLYAVALPRGKAGDWLWYAMKETRVPSVHAAYETLRNWRSRLDFERPFNFYSDVLYAGGGLKRFRARFGAEIDDVMAEFLDLALAHEQAAQPSLLGFLAELRSREVIIKRELADTDAGVRVMTVHGAKGLEAPIVILADAASTEEGRDRRSIYLQEQPPLFIHAASKATHVAETMELKAAADRAQKEEYWRKLYVAMTRAEDELYVTGYLTKARKGAGSWYEAIEQRLRPEAEVVNAEDGSELALIYPASRGDAVPGTIAPAPAPTTAPAFSLPDLPEHRLRRIVRPSSALASSDPDRALETTVERLIDRRDPEAARKEGIALHALLQHLTRVPREHWDSVLVKAMPVLLPDAPDRHQDVAARARSILVRSELADLFGPNSRAEVPILAHGTRGGEPVTIAGRIDRLVVTPQKVTIVDYKSDAIVPASPDLAPSSYATQLGLYALVAHQLYPGAEIEAGILWTSLEKLMILPVALLREAVAGFTIG